jgi:ABC-type transport system substrate-binding protein
MIGTDIKGIMTATLGQGVIGTYPINSSLPTTMYTPLDQLPAADQSLYTYNPTLAKQMLAEAGYPNGFNVTMPFNSATAGESDTGALIQSMWASLGVNVTLSPVSSAAASNLLSTSNFDVILHNWGNVSPLGILDELVPPRNYFKLNDSYINSQYLAVEQMSDTAQWNSAVKALCVYALEQVPEIGLANGDAMVCYWPWLKNYHNELEIGFYNTAEVFSVAWIDQGLKSGLGF